MRKEKQERVWVTIRGVQYAVDSEGECEGMTYLATAGCVSSNSCMRRVNA